MKISIIGAGNVGSTLGKAWAAKGHDIVFGVRDPRSAKAQDVVRAVGAKARAASVPDAAGAADVILLATPWPNAEEALRSAGNLAGKVVIDATNPLKPDLSGLAVGLTSSAGEEVARRAKGARVVKCFNTIGAEHMGNPRIAGQSASMFLCGDDVGAKSTVSKLASELGFDPVDAGPLAQARLLEPLALLWISMAYAHGLGTGIAFKLLRG